MTDAPLPPKKDVALALLNGPSLFVHLDPRRDGVLVPNWFKKQAQLVLQIGLNMAVPIPDIDIGDKAITCTLSFNRSPFWCSVPWSAIFALVGEDGRGMVWPEDVPSEIAAESQKPALKVVPSKKSRKKGKLEVCRADETGGDAAADAPGDAPAAAKPPVLAAVPDAPESDPQAADEADDDAGKKLPPYLRVIK